MKLMLAIVDARRSRLLHCRQAFASSPTCLPFPSLSLSALFSPSPNEQLVCRIGTRGKETKRFPARRRESLALANLDGACLGLCRALLGALSLLPLFPLTYFFYFLFFLSSLLAAFLPSLPTPAQIHSRLTPVVAPPKASARPRHTARSSSFSQARRLPSARPSTEHSSQKRPLHC